LNIRNGKTIGPFLKVSGTLVTARVRDEDAMRIDSILEDYHPVDPAICGTDYRKDGVY
jgi:hypothetical protein